MIVEALWNLVKGIVEGVLDLLPSISVPDLSAMLAGASGLWQWVGWANNFVPVDQLAIVIALIVTWYVVLGVVRAGVWLYGMIRGSATS